MADFTVGGQQYKSGKLDTFVQFDIVKRLAPIFGGIGAVFKNGEIDVPTAVLELAPIVSRIPDEDTHFVFNACLYITQRQQKTGWVKVATPNGGLQFDDIKLPELLQITFNVLRDHFADFFGDLPQKSGDGTKAGE